MQCVFPYVLLCIERWHLRRIEMDAFHANAWQHGAGERKTRTIFDLLSATDHAARTATEQITAFEFAKQHSRQFFETRCVMSADEYRQQVRLAIAQRRKELRRSVRDRSRKHEIGVGGRSRAHFKSLIRRIDRF